jgi:hypothetical protein
VKSNCGALVNRGSTPARLPAEAAKRASEFWKVTAGWPGAPLNARLSSYTLALLMTVAETDAFWKAACLRVCVPAPGVALAILPVMVLSCDATGQPWGELPTMDISPRQNVATDVTPEV